MASSPWQLDDFRARLTLSDELEGDLDLLQPAAGLQLRWRGAGSVTAFALDVPAVHASEAESIIDAWIRERDLVANYGEAESRTTRGQIYWRVARSGDAAVCAPAIDLVASVQTSLLDSDPTLRVRSRIAAGEVLRLSDDSPGGALAIDVSRGESIFRARPEAPSCFLFRLPDGETTYIEMIHPADFAESEVRRLPQGEVELSNCLFPGRLEKGVILRSRLRALFVPRGDDAALARDGYVRFANSEPPLTV